MLMSSSLPSNVPPPHVDPTSHSTCLLLRKGRTSSNRWNDSSISYDIPCLRTDWMIIASEPKVFNETKMFGVWETRKYQKFRSRVVRFQVNLMINYDLFNDFVQETFVFPFLFHQNPSNDGIWKDNNFFFYNVIKSIITRRRTSKIMKRIGWWIKLLLVKEKKKVESN